MVQVAFSEYPHLNCTKSSKMKDSNQKRESKIHFSLLNPIFVKIEIWKN